MWKLLIPLALATLFVYQLAEAEERGAGVNARQHVNFDGVVGDAGVDAREARQREAIRRGMASGEITPREAERLWRVQARIERHERMAETDGRVTRQERARLSRELDHSARHIRHESHERQRVGGDGSGHDRGRRHGHDRGRDYGRHVAHRGGHQRH